MDISDDYHKMIPSSPMEAVTLGLKFMILASGIEQRHAFAILASCLGAQAGFTTLEMSQAAALAEAEILIKQGKKEEA